MGVYKLLKLLPSVKRQLFELKGGAVVLDVENMILQFIKTDKYNSLYIDYDGLIQKYVEPFLKNNITVFAVLSETVNEQNTSKLNSKEFNKLWKNIRKSYHNQEDKKKIEEKEEYFKKISDMFEIHDDWSKTSREIMDNIALYHWLNHNPHKRISNKIKLIFKRELEKKGIATIYEKVDADNFCSCMYHSGVVQAVVSNDTDMFAMDCFVICDVSETHFEYWDKHIFYDQLNECYGNKNQLFDIATKAMEIASADYNPTLYDCKISFKEAFETLLENKGDYKKAFLQLCEKYDKDFEETFFNNLRGCYEHEISCFYFLETLLKCLKKVIPSNITEIYNNKQTNNKLYIEQTFKLFFLYYKLRFLFYKENQNDFIFEVSFAFLKKNIQNTWLQACIKSLK
jgi:hypothetical protein